MSLYKRGKTWHTDFSVNGQGFRQSLDTSDWREAQAKEKELISQASQGKVDPQISTVAKTELGTAIANNPTANLLMIPVGQKFEDIRKRMEILF